MKYRFDILQLEILNVLIFDSSIEFSELQKKPVNGQIEFEIERRTFEDVKRTKFLFWNMTKFKGCASVLRFIGLNKIKLQGINELHQSNHFINEIRYDEDNNYLELITSFGLSVLLYTEPNFKIELENIRESDFGKGSSFGRHGFTKEEWKKNKIEKNYALQQKI